MADWEMEMFSLLQTHMNDKDAALIIHMMKPVLTSSDVAALVAICNSIPTSGIEPPPL